MRIDHDRRVVEGGSLLTVCPDRTEIKLPKGRHVAQRKSGQAKDDQRSKGQIGLPHKRFPLHTFDHGKAVILGRFDRTGQFQP